MPASQSERQRQIDQMRAVKARARWPGTYLKVGATDEVWRLSFECQKCKKPIVYAGKCYACGTGRATTPGGMTCSWQKVVVESGEENTQRQLVVTK